MKYSKEILKTVVGYVIGTAAAESMGLPRAVESSAIHYFLNGADLEEDYAEIIRSALRDINTSGHFLFKEE